MDKIKEFPKWPKQHEDDYLLTTKPGMEQVLESYEKNSSGKNVFWTTDSSVELPVVMKREGVGALPPTTICKEFTKMAENSGHFKAMSVKVQGKWQTSTYKEYYELCKTFGRALISLGITKQKAVNIIGYNNPCWNISFFGSIFGFYMPVGVYTTNGPEACQYVAEHSDAEVVICENRIHLEKYLKVWDKLPQLKYVILYNDNVPDNLPQERKGQVFDWETLMKKGRDYKAQSPEETVEARMDLAKPGLCCTLVYTSGTTGNPKGVMLSHDNYMWTAITFMMSQGVYPATGEESIISFLPLSHVAAQLLDIVGAMIGGLHVYFADPTALQGSLVLYLQEVRPTVFFSVPRVWEKIQEKMQAVAAQNGAIKQKLGDWAKSIGVQGYEAEIKGEKAPFGFGLAKSLIYKNVKKAIGLDRARFVLVGAAPLSPNIRQYFLSLNIYIINAYGMSETTGPQTVSNPKLFDKLDEAAAKSCGLTMDGTDILIYSPDQSGDGEICFKGRNRFMGYYKNEEATRKTIDELGYLHSGDVGKLDQRGNLTITGRLKELLITAGGENVAPVLIENEILSELKFIANAMVVGDARKYLAVILTLKHELNAQGALIPNKILPEALVHLKSIGSNAKTIEEAKNCPIVRKEIDAAIARANTRAISKAQYVQKWTMLDTDFTTDGGHLTPTLKLKRKVVTQMYAPQIEAMYTDAKL